VAVGERLGRQTRGYGQGILERAQAGGVDVQIRCADAGVVHGRLHGAFQDHPARDSMAGLVQGRLPSADGGVFLRHDFLGE
jgi:hypothetical protein